jgi:hypothetical protein
VSRSDNSSECLKASIPPVRDLSPYPFRLVGIRRFSDIDVGKIDRVHFIHSFMFKKPMYYFAIPCVESRLVSCTSGVHELRPNSIVWFDKLSTVYESYDKSTLKCLARVWGMVAG